MATTIDDLIAVKDFAIERAHAIVADIEALDTAVASHRQLRVLLERVKSSAESAISMGEDYDAAEQNEDVCSMEQHEAEVG